MVWDSLWQQETILLERHVLSTLKTFYQKDQPWKMVFFSLVIDCFGYCENVNIIIILSNNYVFVNVTGCDL